MDWLEDRPELDVPRAHLFKTISETPHLNWLLLTKRPENWHNLLQRAYGVAAGENGDELGEPVMSWLSAWLRGEAPPNVWVGTSVENQTTADERIPHLLRIPAAVRFLSCEPLLGPVDLGLFGTVPKDISPRYTLVQHLMHWVIVGGESGPGARPMHPTWARGLRDQCQEAGVPFFFKQWGAWVPRTPRTLDNPDEFDDSMHVWRRWPGPNGDWEMGGADVSVRVGKKAAGRVLDGREWDEVPRWTMHAR